MTRIAHEWLKDADDINIVGGRRDALCHGLDDPKTAFVSGPQPERCRMSLSAGTTDKIEGDRARD